MLVGFYGISILVVYVMPNPYIYIYVYIYIYSHPQTDCLVLSELFSVARHAGRRFVNDEFVGNILNKPELNCLHSVE